MVEFLLQYKKALASVILFITLASVYFITTLKFDSAAQINLADSDPTTQANALLDDHFGGIETTTFVVEASDILAPSALRTVGDLSRDARDLPGVQNAQSVLSIATLVEPATSSTAIELTPFIQTEGQTGTDREALSERIRKHPFAEGTLISKDRTTALVLVSFGQRAYPDPTFNGESIKAHATQAQSLAEKYSHEGVKVYVTGTPAVISVLVDRTQSDTIKIALVALAMLVLVFYLNSPTWIGVLIPLGVTLLSVTWTLGTMGMLGYPIRTVSMYVIVVVMAVGSSYPIHSLAHLQEEMNKQEVHRIAVHLGWFQYSIPILTVAFGAVMSALSLLSFDIADIRELGLFQGLGITFAAILSIFVIPPTVLYFNRPLGLRIVEKSEAGSASDDEVHAPKRSWLRPFLTRISWLAVRFPIPSLAASLVVCAISAYGASLIIPNWVLEESVPHDSDPYRGYSKILEKFGPIKPLLVVVRAPEGKTFYDSANLPILDELETRLAKLPGIKVMPGFASVAKTMNLALLGKPGLPQTQDQLDQILFFTTKKKLSKLVDREGERALLHLTLQDTDPAQSRKTIDGLNMILDQTLPHGYVARVGGSKILYNSLNQYMVKNKIESVILCLIIVFFLCSTIQSSFVLGLIAMAPAAIAGLLTFAIMGFDHIFLDIGTATMTTIAVGVGVDFAIHYLIRLKYEVSIYLFEQKIETAPTRQDYAKVLLRTTRNYGRTIVFDALSNLLGLSALIISVFPVMRQSGILLVENQILVIGTTLFVTPLLVMLFKPHLARKKFSRPNETQKAA